MILKLWGRAINTSAASGVVRRVASDGHNSLRNCSRTRIRSLDMRSRIRNVDMRNCIRSVDMRTRSGRNPLG